MCFQALHGKAERERLPSIFFKGNTNRSIDRLVEESKLQFTRVWLNGVTKDYTRWRGFRRSTFRAVTNVDLLLQKGEIAAILGHNGAGKTTIFNILAGLLPATDGRICIFGKNPLDAWDAINLRKITGVCTQFDVLDDRMTCWEHMRLMGAIKGLNRSETESETFKLFHQLELESYTITATSLLPGGDKRKLSVAMALIGSPRLIMLDEPTSGVDPFSRRCIWRVLRNYRPNRVIVLITHYMDEADILADRKAIMIGGRLVCHGTSKFLKEHYNPGYLLKKPNQTDWINITLVLGRHDDGLCQQIILHHTALWNCMHTRSLKSQGTLTPDISSALWIADVSSWESQWPEKHPQLKLGTACIYLIACNVAYCILSPLIAGDLVREKELRILGQLHLYGMKSWAYWGAHFSTHIFQYLMLACFTTIVMFPFKGHILSSWQNVVLHNWINSLAAFDNIVTIYLFCMFFQSAGGATVLFGSTVMIVIFVNITIYFIPLHMLEAAYGTILFVFPFADPFLTLLLTDFRIRLEKVYLFSTTRAKYVPSLWRLLQYNHVKISQIVHSFRIIIMGVMFVGINIFTHQITPKRKERLYYEGLHRLQPLSELVRQQRTGELFVHIQV
ncbi:unnamed protein product [Dicrocoelium dendriticum]|nr:unnamed protein product [Dicrocoelium dendriticum]